MGPKRRIAATSFLLLSLRLAIAAPAASAAELFPSWMCKQRFTHVGAATADAATALGQLRRFRDRELAIARSPEHASRVRLHLRNHDELAPGRPVVVFLHGLLNSPANFELPEKMAYDSGAHVLNIRLPGHWEHDERALDRVDRADWVATARQALDWASRLGGPVTLVGHSTGGLIAAALAAREPARVQRLVLFSPAFEVGRESWLESYGLAALHVSGWIKGPATGDRRYLSTFAGREVSRLAREVRGHDDHAALIAGLHGTRVLWFDTAVDGTIAVRANDRISRALAEAGTRIRRVIVGPNYRAPHHRMGSLEGREREIVEPRLERFFHDTSAN